MLKFERIEILYLMGVIPLMIIAFWLSRRSKKKALNKFASEDLRDFLIPLYSPIRHVLKIILLLVGFGFLITGLAGPRVGAKLKEVKKTGREIIIALDVSNSMLAEDIKPNRLEMARQSLNRLLNDLEDDRIGLIVFAGDAYTQIPVTNDYGAARLFLNTVSTNMVSKQGTAISSAIELATRSFSATSRAEGDEQGKARAVIIITDGENHEDDAIEAAREAAEKGIVIHTIGIGDPDGVPIPLFPGSNDVRRDKDGNVVVSKLDETGLRKIASITSGFYVHATNSAGVQQLMKKLEEIESEEYTAKIFSEYIERYQYFVGAGLFLIILELLILARKNPWFEKLKIFE